MITSKFGVLLHELSFHTYTKDIRRVKLYVLSTTTGKQHPLAQQPILQLPESGTGVFKAIRIREDLCAVAMNSGGTEYRIFVWHWKTGECLAVRPFGLLIRIRVIKRLFFT